MLAGHVVVLLGAVLVVSRVLSVAGASVGRPKLNRALVLSLASAGALAGMSLVISAGRTESSAIYWVIPAWMAATAAAAPALVAFIRPGPLGAWLLLGWLLGAGVGVLRYLQFQEGQGATEAMRSGTWAAAAVALLVPLVVVLAWVARRSPAAASPAEA